MEVCMAEDKRKRTSVVYDIEGMAVELGGVKYAFEPTDEEVSENITHLRNSDKHMFLKGVKVTIEDYVADITLKSGATEERRNALRNECLAMINDGTYSRKVKVKGEFIKVSKAQVESMYEAYLDEEDEAAKAVYAKILKQIGRI
jgi:hypothetical protein